MDKHIGAFDSALLEKLALEYYFLNTLLPEKLRQHVWLAKLTSLQAAVAEAEMAEPILNNGTSK